MTQAATAPQAPRPGVNPTSLAELKASTRSLPAETQIGFFTAGGLDLMQRAAHLLSNSTLVPKQYQSLWVKRDKYGNQEGQPTQNPNAISVFPTRVGMNRRACEPEECQESVPHTRGDEPLHPDEAGIINVCSPHAWG